MTTPRRRSGLNGLCLGERRRIALTREGLQEHRLVILTDLDVDDDVNVDVVEHSWDSSSTVLESFRVALAALAF